MSDTSHSPAREDIDAPLILERTGPPLDLDLVSELEAETRALADLPPPFRRIIAIHRDPSGLQILEEHFVGVSGRQLMRALGTSRRLLPLDVWLALADTLCRAWGSIPSGGVAWRMVPTIDCFGVDVKRRVVVFPDPLHTIPAKVRRLSTPVSPASDHENHSPEHYADGIRLEESSRVFSLATVLVHLLTNDRPYRSSSPFGPRPEQARWRANNHPECGPGLSKVLAAGLELRPEARPATLESFRQQLLSSAGCAPASPERVGNMVLGADLEQVRRELAKLRGDPELLPVSWRAGGLDVLEDQLLEAVVPIEQLPASRAPAPNVGPTAPPRVNLVRAPRRAWWEAIWPFRRT